MKLPQLGGAEAGDDAALVSTAPNADRCPRQQQHRLQKRNAVVASVCFKRDLNQSIGSTRNSSEVRQTTRGRCRNRHFERDSCCHSLPARLPRPVAKYVLLVKKSDRREAICFLFFSPHRKTHQSSRSASIEMHNVGDGLEEARVTHASSTNRQH